MWLSLDSSYTSKRVSFSSAKAKSTASSDGSFNRVSNRSLRYGWFFFLVSLKVIFCCLQSEEKEVVINPPIDTTTVNINTGGAGKMAIDQGSPGDSDSSLLMIADLEKRMRDLFLVLADDHKVTARAEQDRTLSAFRSHLDRLVKMIVQRELQVQRMLIKSASDDGRAHLVRACILYEVMRRCSVRIGIAHFVAAWP